MEHQWSIQQVSEVWSSNSSLDAMMAASPTPSSLLNYGSTSTTKSPPGSLQQQQHRRRSGARRSLERKQQRGGKNGETAPRPKLSPQPPLSPQSSPSQQAQSPSSSRTTIPPQSLLRMMPRESTGLLSATPEGDEEQQQQLQIPIPPQDEDPRQFEESDLLLPSLNTMEYYQNQTTNSTANNSNNNTPQSAAKLLALMTATPQSTPQARTKSPYWAIQSSNTIDSHDLDYNLNDMDSSDDDDDDDATRNAVLTGSYAARHNGKKRNHSPSNNQNHNDHQPLQQKTCCQIILMIVQTLFWMIVALLLPTAALVLTRHWWWDHDDWGGEFDPYAPQLLALTHHQYATCRQSARWVSVFAGVQIGLYAHMMLTLLLGQVWITCWRRKRNEQEKNKQNPTSTTFDDTNDTNGTNTDAPTTNPFTIGVLSLLALPTCVGGLFQFAWLVYGAILLTKSRSVYPTYQPQHHTAMSNSTMTHHDNPAEDAIDLANHCATMATWAQVYCWLSLLSALCNHCGIFGKQQQSQPEYYDDDHQDPEQQERLKDPNMDNTEDDWD